ncbi:MAG TPA: branched-chain amino acid ABC transporter permease [Candidatus Acidoferrales bacterium]|nr:branched-chain amino acid ABC transporter permease [Candidatus Acidoferrales bacterium]
MHALLVLTVEGLVQGSIYAAVALALVLIWRATKVINFAQGAMAMFTTYVALVAIHHGLSYWVAFAIAIVCGFALGAVVERVLVRPVEIASPFNVVILTLGLYLFLEAIVPMLFGGSIQSFPPAFAITGMELGKVQVPLSGFDIFTFGCLGVAAVVLTFFFRRTNLGLRMRASAFSPEVSRLLGIRVGRMLTTGWALAAALGALAGVLIAPTVLLQPTYMDEVFIFGFTGAILGGLESLWGSVVGGLVIGLVLTFVGYVSPDLETLAGLIILTAILMVRPQGLFSVHRERRV